MKSKNSSFFRSLTFQIVVAALLGIAAGTLFGEGMLKPLAQVGKLVIHWVKLIAGPFLFFTVTAAIVEVKVEWRHGMRLLGIALLNTSVALVIGILLARFFLFDIDTSSLPARQAAEGAPAVGSLGLDSWVKTLSPKSLIEPFVTNEILLIALLALALGLALRVAFRASPAATLTKIAARLENCRSVVAVLLGWVIHAIPVAVFTLIAGSVSEFGLGILASLAKYVVVVLLGFALQITFVYAPWIQGYARVRLKDFARAAREPVCYALGVNSSLATLPLTLTALDKLGVSKRSASLGAGVATNLNNDGIILYEAMAVFFIAHLHGIPMEGSDMVVAALACLVAALGITGIPEAGFIALSVVVAALKLPAETLPLLLAVDWIIARGRSAVNVLSDMTLSIALDAAEGKTARTRA